MIWPGEISVCRGLSMLYLSYPLIWLLRFFCGILLLSICLSCSPSPGDAKPLRYNVGFTIYELNYTDGDGAEEVLTLAVWYPTAEETSLYTYNKTVRFRL